MIQILSWVFAVIAIVGAVLNARQSIKGFYLWLVSNTGFIVINFLIGMPAQATLFIVYNIITVYGIYQWRKTGG